MVNPYSVTSAAPLQSGVFSDHARRLDGTFLYRVIQIENPFEAELVYSGWWFRQTIDVQHYRVWKKISWLTILSSVHFFFPKQVDPLERPGHIEIDFGRGLQIKRFRLWIDQELVYDEVSR